MSPRSGGTGPLGRRAAPIGALRRLARSSRERERQGAFVADGVRLLEEAVGRGAAIRLALTSSRLEREPRGRALAKALGERAARCCEATEEAIAAILGMERHQGVVAEIERRLHPLASILGQPSRPPLLVACGVQDPGNLGSLLRVAAAAGGGGLLATSGTADPWNPKAVRGSAGAIFHLPVAAGLEGTEMLHELGRASYTPVMAVASGGTPHFRIDWRRPVALVLGSEGAGVPPELRGLISESVSLPMAAAVESLNVLAAAAVLLYEAARWRGLPGGRPWATRARG